jgi:hypothetical protein
MKKAFLTDDFEVLDFESENAERYTFTRQELDPADYSFQPFKDWKKENEGDREDYQQAFQDWAENELTFEEIYNVPMMNSLYYFPSFVSFRGDEPTSGSTCLIYDNELEKWAVGMTGGGMDLSPHLLDTFLMLGKGVPAGLASGIRRDWPAYVNDKRHTENCDKLAEAMRKYGEGWMFRAERLKREK